MSSKSAQKFQDAVSAHIGKLYLEDLASNRQKLEEAAMERACPCTYDDLESTINKTPDEDLMAIVIKAEPCETCSK